LGVAQMSSGVEPSKRQPVVLFFNFFKSHQAIREIQSNLTSAYFSDGLNQATT